MPAAEALKPLTSSSSKVIDGGTTRVRPVRIGAFDVLATTAGEADMGPLEALSALTFAGLADPNGSALATVDDSEGPAEMCAVADKTFFGLLAPGAGRFLTIGWKVKAAFRAPSAAAAAACSAEAAAYLAASSSAAVCLSSSTGPGWPALTFEAVVAAPASLDACSTLLVPLLKVMPEYRPAIFRGRRSISRTCERWFEADRQRPIV